MTERERECVTQTDRQTDRQRGLYSVHTGSLVDAPLDDGVAQRTFTGVEAAVAAQSLVAARHQCDVRHPHASRRPARQRHPGEQSR